MKARFHWIWNTAFKNLLLVLTSSPVLQALMGKFCLSGHICHSGEYCSKYLHPKHWQKWYAVVAILVCKVTNVAGILELSVADFRYRNERKGGMRACHGQEFKKIVKKLLWVLYFRVCCYDVFRKYSGTQGVHQSREWVLEGKLSAHSFIHSRDDKRNSILVQKCYLGIEESKMSIYGSLLFQKLQPTFQKRLTQPISSQSLVWECESIWLVKTGGEEMWLRLNSPFTGGPSLSALCLIQSSRVIPRRGRNPTLPYTNRKLFTCVSMQALVFQELS